MNLHRHIDIQLNTLLNINAGEICDGTADNRNIQMCAGPHFKRKNRGAAMIVVVCVMAVVMILSLTLLMAAYQMLATVADEGRDELYYQQAMSFSEVLRTRMDEYSSTGITTDDLVTHINSFVNNNNEDAPTKEILDAPAPVEGGVYGSITVVLDKKISRNNLVITITVSDEGKAMSSCTCKYEIDDDNTPVIYIFKGYYKYPEVTEETIP